MNGNRVVIAILLGALCISAAVYFGGKRSENVPTVLVPESATSQTETVVLPASPSALASEAAELEDLSSIADAIGNDLNIDPETLRITKSKQIENYATGSVTTEGEETGGGQWWGVKEEGAWKLIYSGQGYPNCLVIAPYHIPAKLLDSCWDTTTNTLQSL